MGAGQREDGGIQTFISCCPLDNKKGVKNRKKKLNCVTDTYGHLQTVMLDEESAYTSDKCSQVEMRGLSNIKILPV